MLDIVHLKRVFFSPSSCFDLCNLDVHVLCDPSTRRQVLGYWSTPTMTRNFMYKIKEAVAVFSPRASSHREALSFPGWFSTRNIL